MTPALATTQKDRIAIHLQQGLSCSVVAAVEDVGERTVARIKARLRTYGEHTAPRMSAKGPAPLVHPAARIGLKYFLENQPWAYQEEMQYYLFDDWNLTVSQATVSKVLKAMKINRKCLKREALERSQECRNMYFTEVSPFGHEMLVFLDESAANEHTMHRKRGWASYGISPRIIRPVKRSERWSILPAYCSDGILAKHIHQGSISGARFEWFLTNEILPRCSRFPRPKSVLILDNASVHHSQVSLNHRIQYFI